MSTLFGILLTLTAVVVFPAFLIWCIINLLRKRRVKSQLFGMLGSFIGAIALFIAFGMTYDGPVQSEVAEDTPRLSTTPTQSATPLPSDAPTLSPEPTQVPTPTPSPTASPTTSVAPTPTTTSTMKPIDKDSINKALIKKIPEEYQDNKWFFVLSTISTEQEMGIGVSIQIDLKSDDFKAAKEIAVQYYDVAETVAQDNGCVLASYDMMLVNNGAPIGFFMTRDGKSYTVLADRETTEFEVE